MTTFPTPCTVLTAFDDMVCADDCDSLEDAARLIRELAEEHRGGEEEEPQAAPDYDEDDYLFRPWRVEGWTKAEWLYAGYPQPLTSSANRGWKRDWEQPHTSTTGEHHGHTENFLLRGPVEIRRTPRVLHH